MLVDKSVLPDVAVFHVSGEVNIHNTCVWGTENRRKVLTYERANEKVAVFAAISRKKVYGTFSFAEITVTGIVYLALFVLTLDKHMRPDAMLRRDCEAPHFLRDVCNFLDKIYPGKRIGLGGHIARPPRSPDLTPLDFTLWVFV